MTALPSTVFPTVEVDLDDLERLLEVAHAFEGARCLCGHPNGALLNRVEGGSTLEAKHARHVAAVKADARRGVIR